MKIKLSRKEKLKYILLITLIAAIVNAGVFYFIKKDQQELKVKTVPFVNQLVYKEEESFEIAEEVENSVSLSKVNKEKELEALIPYSQKVVLPVEKWNFSLNGLENKVEGRLYYPKEKLPIKVDLYSSEDNSYFEIYSPESKFQINDLSFEAERNILLKKEISRDSVISINMEDYLFFDDLGIKKLNIKDLTYKYEDIKYGVEHISFNKENLLEEPEVNPYIESVGEIVPPLSYTERYTIDIESFEPYLLSFDYKNDDQIIYGYRLYKEDYLDRLEKLKKGEPVEKISKEDWEKLYQEIVIEDYEVKDNQWDTFQKVIETTLPDIVGIEIIVYDEKQDPKNLYKNFRLQKAKNSEFIEMEHIDENLDSEITFAEGIEIGQENKIGIAKSVDEKDIVINSDNLGFDKGVWHNSAYDCTINKVGDPELVEMKLSSEQDGGGNVLELVSKTNHRACTVNTFYFEDFNEDTLKISFKAKKENKVSLIGYHYILHGEFGDFVLGSDVDLEDDNYIKSGTKIYDAKAGEWAEFTDYINLNRSTISRIGKIEGITLRFNSIRDGGEDARVLFDDINITALDQNLPVLENLFLETVNQFDYEKSKQLLLLDRSYSDKWSINSVEEKFHYKTDDGKNLWLGVIDKEVEVRNSYWSVGRISVVFLMILVFILIWMIWYFEFLMKFAGVVNNYIERFKAEIKDKYSDLSKSFLRYNESISDRFIKPLLCKFFEVEEFDYEWFVVQRKKLFKEIDRILKQIFSDFINRPILDLILAGLGGISYLVLGNIYYVILIVIFLFWLVNEWDSVVLAFAAMINLCIVPVMLVLNKDIWAEKFSLLVYFFLIMTVILQIIEYVKFSYKEEK